MKTNNTLTILFATVLSCLVMIGIVGCSVSYKLNGASIDYTKVKTISIRDFSNLAPLVYPPLAQRFTEDLRERFQTRTKLSLQPAGGDLNIEGEIVGYDLTAEAVQEDAYSAKTKITMRVKVRYSSRINPEEDFEKEFSSFTTFDSKIMFTDVQDALCKEMIDDIIQQIFNSTVENW